MRSVIENISLLVTMNNSQERLADVSIVIEDNIITQITKEKVCQKCDKVIDGRNRIALPGFVNTHHHLFQSFLRHVPELQNQPIDIWIATVCSLTKKMDAEAHYHAALINMMELLFSGCTTTTDMLYIFPEQYDHIELFEATIQAAHDLGMRFHPFRGSMSLSQKDGALFADDVVEKSSEIIARTDAVIKKFHQPAADSMVKVGIAPCTLFTSSTEDYEQAVTLARKYDLNLQTHVSESAYEQEYSQKTFGKTPVAHLSSMGWNDSRASFVHGIEVNDRDLTQIKKQHNSICHCPISNARSPLGQKGIAPITEMLNAGINVSVGVDGSAGNDSSNMLEEMRWARTLQGAREESTYLSAQNVLYMGTRGGAKTLRWDQKIGSLEVGKCADIALFNLEDSLAHVGAWDRVGSLVSCQAIKADTVMVNGKVLIQDGELTSVNQKKAIAAAWSKWKKIFGKRT